MRRILVAAAAVGLAIALNGRLVLAKDPPPASTAAIPQFSHHSHAELPQFKEQIAKERARGLKTAGVTDVDFLPCAECHSLDAKSGEPLPPGKDGHKPCSDLRCHGPRMGNLELPKKMTGGLCAECHEKAEKFFASPPRFIHREERAREFGWRINHRRHLGVPGLEQCDTCHKLTKAVVGEDVTVSVHRPGHADCAPCHGKSGSKPSLTQCNSCHLIGQVPKPKPTAAGAWRVYEKFTHDTHRLDVRTAKVKTGGMGRGWSRYDRASAQTLGCGACHSTAAKAESIQDMDLLGPCAMGKTCMGQCHNGKWAFQGSGTSMKDCLLCHSEVNENTPAPTTHCGS